MMRRLTQSRRRLKPRIKRSSVGPGDDLPGCVTGGRSCAKRAAPRFPATSWRNRDPARIQRAVAGILPLHLNAQDFEPKGPCGALGNYFSRCVAQRGVESGQLQTVFFSQISQIPIGALARTGRWDALHRSGIASNERRLLLADEILQQ